MLKKTLAMPLVIVGVIVGITLGVAAGSNLQEIKALINSDIKIKLNNSVVQLKDKDGSDLKPIIYNSKTYVPLKSISDLLNVNIDWDGTSSSVLIGQSDASRLLPKLDGQYINTNYISNLKQTKSIVFSNSIDRAAYIGFGKNNITNKYYLSVSMDFHQNAGGDIGVFDKLTQKKEEFYNDKGEKQNKEVAYYGISTSGNSEYKHILRIGTEDKINAIELLGDFGLTHEYIKIDEPIGTYINRVLFDGSYKDESGKTYIFDGDNAIWDNRKFEYCIDLDVVETEKDLITATYSDGTSEKFGFKFEDNNLYLYKTSYDQKDGYEKLVVNTSPYLKLQKAATK